MQGRAQDTMVKFACRPPAQNARSITTSARQILGYDGNKLLSAFGVSVGRDLLTVRGRELSPPAIEYLGSNMGKMVTPKAGSWDTRGQKVFTPCRPIKCWTFLHIRGKNNNQKIVRERVFRLGRFIANNMGINIRPNPDPAPAVPSEAEQDVKPAFQELSRRSPRPELIIVVIEERNPVLYKMVKKFADIYAGIATVCVTEAVLTREGGWEANFANIGLKVNMKFGGVNHRLHENIDLLSSGKTMLVGYDVTHPTGPTQNAPSLVGMVASVDRHAAQYPATAWNNPSRVESLDGELVARFQSRLNLWQENNQQGLPENIIIFRDGVSESQFKMVLERELPHIRSACQATYGLSKKALPRISVIVAVKRHNTRFYPTDHNHMDPRSKSPKEGTVVDRGVTTVRYWDFFLQAHASIQGTPFLSARITLQPNSLANFVGRNRPLGALHGAL